MILASGGLSGLCGRSPGRQGRKKVQLTVLALPDSSCYSYLLRACTVSVVSLTSGHFSDQTLAGSGQSPLMSRFSSGVKG